MTAGRIFAVDPTESGLSTDALPFNGNGTTSDELDDEFAKLDAWQLEWGFEKAEKTTIA